MVGEAGAVVAHGGFGQHDGIRHQAIGPFGGVLLGHAPGHVFFGVADLQQARVVRAAVGIGVDHWVRCGTPGKKFLIRHRRRRSNPWGESWIQ